jgi:choline dehydrogenase-like flavoprotein
MTERFDHIVIGGGAAGCVAAARLVTDGGARVLLLEAGHSHRHPLLDMPPGIFKMINGSKFMRYHQTVPQEHLNGRVHDIPQGHVLGGGSSVNAQVYMRGRPSDYDEWHDLLRGENDYPGWGWADVLPHFRGMEGNDRLHDELHGADGPAARVRPGHINDFSRWFVQAVQALGRALQPRLQRAEPARRRLLPVHEPAREAQQRGLRLPRAAAATRTSRSASARVRRIDIENGRARGRHVSRREGRRAHRSRTARSSSRRRASSRRSCSCSPASARRTAQAHGIAASRPARRRREPRRPSRGADHRQGQRPHGYYGRASAGGCSSTASTSSCSAAGPILSAGVEAGAFVNPADPAAEPTIQAFCVPDRLPRPRHAGRSSRTPTG